MTNFHNPYNFIPLGKPLKDMLGQRAPAGHDKYGNDLWSGRIEIKIETVTPLLIPDASTAKEDPAEHKIFTIRMGPDGKPLLPVTSLKGPLRAAYEAVTNSRLPFFRGHNEPSARRMTTQDAQPLVPARADAAGHFEILGGYAARLDFNGRQRPALLGAWLKRYTWDERAKALVRSGAALTYPGGGEPQHGDAVICEIELCRRAGRFPFWQVIQIQPARSATLRVANESDLEPEKGDWRERDKIVVRGYVFISHHNTGNKHDERVFFTVDRKPFRLPIEETVRRRWEQLILDYKERHRDAVEKREADRKRADWSYGVNIGETAFSRHILDPGYEVLANRLCYVRLNRERTAVLAAFPVTIAREIGHVSPEDLLPDEMRPAESLEHLSPADRVFGWANANGHGAYKGQLRLHSTQCVEGGVETFPAPLPLAILGEPKVAQARFYVGKRDGRPLDRQAPTEKEAYFDQEHPEKWGLRGRKVYPHHAAIEQIPNYWSTREAGADATSRTVDEAGRAGSRRLYREYVRRKDGQEPTADSQNRSIREWVKPKTKFAASIDVINLNIAELGVLLWLLDLPAGPQGEPAHHRIGGGKPLGFGSVKISVLSVDLCTGAAKRARYRSFTGKPDYSGFDRQHVCGGCESAASLREAAEKAWGGKFEDLPSAKPFLRAARGPHGDAPTHYPRTTVHPDPAGKNFEWFGNNEADRKGQKLALPSIEDERGLPLDPKT